MNMLINSILIIRRNAESINSNEANDETIMKPMKRHRSYTDLYDVSHAVDTFTMLTPLIEIRSSSSIPRATSVNKQLPIIPIIRVRRRQSFPSLEGDNLRREIRTKQFI